MYGSCWIKTVTLDLSLKIYWMFNLLCDFVHLQLVAEDAHFAATHSSAEDPKGKGSWIGEQEMGDLCTLFVLQCTS